MHRSELASQREDQRRGQERRCERVPFPEEPGGDGMGTEGNGVRGDTNPGEAQGAGTRRRGGRRAGGARGPGVFLQHGSDGAPRGRPGPDRRAPVGGPAPPTLFCIVPAATWLRPLPSGRYFSRSPTLCFRGPQTSAAGPCTFPKVNRRRRKQNRL